jgi:hypothetical protein
MPYPSDSRSVGIGNTAEIPQNRELRYVRGLAGRWLRHLLRWQIEEGNGLTIKLGESLELDVIDATFAQLALGDEGGTLTHLRANFPLSQANLRTRLFQTMAKVFVGFLILMVLWVHTLEIYSPVD